MAHWRILCYHTVDASAADAFARQLHSFRRRGFRFCTITQGLALLDSRDQGRWLTVSFDDGDTTVCRHAQPVLDEQRINAMLYVATDYIVQGSIYRAPHPRPAASWEQLGRWIEAGHEIGSHTHTHVPLARCSAERAGEELERSRAILGEELGITVAHFAYPWGQHDEATRRWLRDAGAWASAATIDRGWNRGGADPLRLHREVVEPTWPARRVRLTMAVGACPPLYRLQRWIRRPAGYWDAPDRELFD